MNPQLKQIISESFTNIEVKNALVKNIRQYIQSDPIEFIIEILNDGYKEQSEELTYY